MTATLSLSPASISEDGGIATVTATLDKSAGAEVKIAVSTTPQAAVSPDFALSLKDTLTIAAGEKTSTGDVTITANDNDLNAPDKTIAVQGAVTSRENVVGPTDVTLTITDDDAMPTVTLVLSPMSIHEGGGVTTVTATMDQPSSEITTVTISAVPQMPATSVDYTLGTNRTLTIASGQTASTGRMVTITANDNAVDAPDKMIMIQGSASNTHGVADPAAVTLTITDDDAPPTMTLKLSSVSISENSGIAEITAELDRPSSEMTTVTISVVPQTPAILADYTSSPNLTLTIAAGQTTSTGVVTITANDNAVDAPDKMIIIQGSASNTHGVTDPAAVALTITDDDIPPTVTLKLSSASISENSGVAEITAELDRPSSEMTTVTISVVPQTPAILADYTSSPNLTLTIAAGQMTSTGVVTITANDNAVDAPDKMVTIRGSATNLQGITDPADVTITITDDDLASVTAPVSVAVTEGSSTDFPVVLGSQPTGNVTVTITGQAATDLTPSPQTLTFTTTNWSTLQPVTLTADEDTDLTNDQVALTLTASGGGYAGVTQSILVTITDNDMAAVAAPTSVVVFEGGSVNLPVAHSSPQTADVTLTITGYAATDLTPNPTVLAFTPASWNVAQTIVLIAAEDRDFVNDPAVLTLRAQGGGYARVTHAVAVTIIDNDVASLAAPTFVVVPEGGSNSLSVALSSPPTAEVTLTAMGHAATDLTPTPSALTFTTANWATAQTVTLTAAEDPDLTDDPLTLMLTTSGGRYTGVTHSVAVTITDNDVAAVTAPIAVVVPEGGTISLPVALSSQPTAGVMVTVTGHAATDLTPNPTVLTFLPTNWHAPQTVTLAAVEDGDFTNDQVPLTLTASGGGYEGVAHSTLVTITDNDVAAVTAPMTAVVPEGGSSSLPVALSAPPAGEVMLTVTGHAGTDLTPTPPVVVFTPTDWATDQTVTLTAAEDGDFTDDPVMLTLLASGGGYAGVTHSVAVTITDNDVGAVTAPTSVVIPEGGRTDLPVALLSPPTAAVTLTIVGYAGTDLAPNPVVVTFTPTDWNVTQTIVLRATEDEDFVDDVATLTLTASGGGYTGVTHSVAVTITDDDVPIVTVPTSVVIPEGGTSDLLVALSAQPTAAVTLTITGHAGTDLTSAPLTLTFTRANWNVPQTIVLTAAEDEDFVDDSVTLTFAASGDGYSGVTHSVAVTITDNDTEVPLSLSIYDLEVLENAKTGQLRVELNRPSDQVVTVQYATSDGTAEKGSDYTASRGIVVFDRHATKGVIPVGILDDDIPEEQEQLTVTLSKPKNAAIAQAAGTLTIVDNDGGVTLRIGDEVVEADAGVIRFTVQLSRPSSESVTVAYRTADGTAKAGEDYRASSDAVEFAPGAVTATIAVPLLLKTLDRRQFSVHLEQSTHAQIAKAVAVPAWRLRGDVQTQGLVMHTAEGFTEWGVSGSVQVGEQAQGLMLRMRPSWGTGMSLSHQQTVLDIVPTGQNRTEMELGYGVAMGQGTARSILGAT